jgi:hypothetical protein
MDIKSESQVLFRKPESQVLTASELMRNRPTRKNDGTLILPEGTSSEILTNKISAGTEGRDVFIVLESTANRTNGSAAFVGPDYTAFAQSKPMPLVTDVGYPYTQILWLAFASGHFFGSITTNPFTMDSPILNTIDKDPNRVMGVFLNQGEIKLPKEMAFIDLGYNVVGGGKFTRPAPYNHGFRAASYSVTDTIETNSLLFPKEFVFALFSPKDGGTDTNDLDTYMVYHCVVTNFVFGGKADNFIPEFPVLAGGKSVSVKDTRASIQPYTYDAHSWPTVESITDTPEFQTWLRRHPGSRPSFLQPPK